MRHAAWSQRYAAAIAVDNLSFDVRPGTVTGFLGPNGAGKSTTMRMMLGLDRPDAGAVRIGGKRLPRAAQPAARGRRAARGQGLPPGTHRQVAPDRAGREQRSRRRVDEVLEITGLEKAADKRAGKFSLGMAQRLGIAAALLGDPAVLLLDEPVNGLDPEGIRWIRDLLKNLAAQGRTVLISSHLISEVARPPIASSSSAGAACSRRPRWPNSPPQQLPRRGVLRAHRSAEYSASNLAYQGSL